MSSNVPNTLTFDDEIMTFLMINLFGHDFFHDFNTSAMNKRFKAINKLSMELAPTEKSPTSSPAKKKSPVGAVGAVGAVEIDETDDLEEELEVAVKEVEEVKEVEKVGDEVASEGAAEKVGEKVGDEVDSEGAAEKVGEESEKENSVTVARDIEGNAKNFNDFYIGASEEEPNLEGPTTAVLDDYSYTGEYNNFGKYLTRSNARKFQIQLERIQKAKETIHKSKLLVMNSFNNKKRTSGGSAPRTGASHSYVIPKSNITLSTVFPAPYKQIQNNEIIDPTVGTKSVESPIAVSLDNSEFNYTILSGFHWINDDCEKMIAESEEETVKEYKQIQKHFIMMKDLYVYLFENNHTIHPLDIFNSTLIENALLLLFIDEKYNGDGTEYSSISIEELLNESKNISNDSSAPSSPSQVGGGDAINKLIDLINSKKIADKSYIEFLNEKFDIGRHDPTILHQIYEFIFDELTKMQSDDPSTPEGKLIKEIQKKIQKKETIMNAIKERALKRSRGGPSQYFSELSSVLIYAYGELNGFKISEDLKIATAAEKAAEKAAAAVEKADKAAEREAEKAASSSYTVTDRLEAFNINKTVAYGVLTHILGCDNLDSASSVAELKFNRVLFDKKFKDELLKYEIGLIFELYNKRGISEIDKKLRSKIIEYYYTEGNDQFKSKTKIKPELDMSADPLIKDYLPTNIPNNNVIIINNAINKDILAKLNEILKSKVICPVASLMDAMGSLGSCINPASANLATEIENMEFLLQNQSGTINYFGQVIVKPPRNSGSNIVITYNAFINDFHIPHVQILMKPNGNELSAGSTYKVLVDKIILLWRTAPFPTDQNFFWETLKNSSIFTDILTVSTRKSVGDFFQEITGVAIYGGYRSAFLKEKENRFFVANDSPSGVRAIVMLSKALSGVRLTSTAGYISERESIIYTKNGTSIKPGKKRGGSKSQKKYNTKKNSTYKKKRATKRKRNSNNKRTRRNK
jgi:hypothetical protein